MKRIVGNELVDFIETGLENFRQSLPKVHIVNGALYIVKRDILVKDRSFKGQKCLPFEMRKVESINIDDELDFLLVEQILKNGREAIEVYSRAMPNHNGDENTMLKMVEAASTAGATHVKIQHIFSENLSFRPQFEEGLTGDGSIVYKKALQRRV